MSRPRVELDSHGAIVVALGGNPPVALEPQEALAYAAAMQEAAIESLKSRALNLRLGTLVGAVGEVISAVQKRSRRR